MTSEAILTVEELSVELPGPLRVVHDVGFTVAPGEITGIVGETGSGKTVSMLATFGLLPEGSRVGGRIRFADTQLEPGGVSREPLLGRRMAMVFQDARSSLHPTFSIGRQLDWALKRARPAADRAARRTRAVELLETVGLQGSESELRAYPFELSGGMCQRAAIAIALASEAELLVADEPTSALDPTIQLQIADLLDRLVRASGLACVLITHDIRLVRYVCDQVVVLRDGRAVERGPVEAVMADPADPYTRLLLEATIS